MSRILCVCNEGREGTREAADLDEECCTVCGISAPGPVARAGWTLISEAGFYVCPACLTGRELEGPSLKVCPLCGENGNAVSCWASPAASQRLVRCVDERQNDSDPADARPPDA